MSFLVRILCAGLVAMVPCAMAAQEPESDVLALDSLLNTPIDASGKYQQTAREAASSVTIVTHEQIAHFGYRTLNDVLQGGARPLRESGGSGRGLCGAPPRDRGAGEPAGRVYRAGGSARVD